MRTLSADIAFNQDGLNDEVDRETSFILVRSPQVHWFEFVDGVKHASSAEDLFLDVPPVLGDQSDRKRFDGRQSRSLIVDDLRIHRQLAVAGGF